MSMALRGVRCFVVILLGGVGVAGQSPAQEAKGEPVLGEVIVQTIPARHYLSGSIETDFKSIGAPVVKTLTEMGKAAGEAKLSLYGPVVHFYHGAPHQAPDKPFRMETGFFVPEETKPLGDFKVRQLPALECATVIYTGPAPRIGEAWQKLYRAIRARGLTPTDDERELYLYWEGVDSPNNIVQAQVGVK